MEIFLTAGCSSLSGYINRNLGYFIARRDGRFFSQRSNKVQVPPDGHWNFIVTCAQLAQNKYCIADIEVSGFELKIALSEACLFESSLCIDLDHVYNADDVLTFKQKRGL